MSAFASLSGVEASAGASRTCRCSPYRLRCSELLIALHVPIWNQQRSTSAQRAALAPLVPWNGPVAVLCECERWAAAVANFDDVAGHREAVEPFGVVAVEVQAAVA